MKNEGQTERDQVFGSYAFEASTHVAVRISFSIVMPRMNDRAMVAYGRKHIEGEEYMTDAQVIAHLAAMVLAGLGDGLVENPDWMK